MGYYQRLKIFNEEKVKKMKKVLVIMMLLLLLSNISFAEENSLTILFDESLTNDGYMAE